MHSPRTSLVLTDLALVSDLAQYLGTALDSMLEVLLQNLLKACSSSKKLISNAAMNAFNELLKNTSYHIRTLNTIQFAVNDKNAQVRAFASTFVKTLLETHGHQRYDVITRSGGVDIIEKCLRKGVTDANQSARETSRESFRIFWELWQDRAQQMLNAMDPSTKKQMIRQLGSLYTAATKGIVVSNKPPLKQQPSTSSGGRNTPLGKQVLKVSTDDQTASSKNKAKRSSTSSTTSTSSTPLKSPPQSPRRPSSRLSNASSTSGTVEQQRPVSPVSSRRSTTTMAAKRSSVTSPPPSAASPASPTSAAMLRHQIGSSPPLRPVSVTRSSSPAGVSKRPTSPAVMNRRSQSVASHRGPTATRRAGSSLGHRRLPLIDQLKHADSRVRTEGINEMTNMIHADGSSYEALVESKALPPAHILSPVLLSLFTDNSAEVVKTITQQDQVQAVTQVVSLDQIISRVISVEGIDASATSSGRPSTLQRLKENLSDYFVAPALCRCLISGGGNGVAKKAGGGTSISTRRKVMAGVIIWMREIVLRALDQENDDGYDARCYFADSANFKLYLTRLFPLVSATASAPNTHANLVDLLLCLRRMNHALFDQVLYSFDETVVHHVEDAIAAYLEQHGQEEVMYDEPQAEDAQYGQEEDEVSVPASQAQDEEEHNVVDVSSSYTSTQHLADTSITVSTTEHDDHEVLTEDVLPANDHGAAEPRSPPTTPPRQQSVPVVEDTSPALLGNVLPSNVAEKIGILQRSLVQLRVGNADNLVFRKLIRLAKETSMDVDAELSSSVWGADGEHFIALVTECVRFMERETDSARKEYCVLLIKQLLHCEATFLGDQASVVLRCLLTSRMDESHAICSAADDALETFVSLVDRRLCLEALLTVMESQHESAQEEPRPSNENNMSMLFGLKTHSTAVTHTLVSKLLTRYTDSIPDEESIAKIAKLAIRVSDDMIQGKVTTYTFP
jgi:hypothetical protein